MSDFFHRAQKSFVKINFLTRFQLIFWIIYGVGSFPIHYAGMRFAAGWHAPLHAVVLFKLMDNLYVVCTTTILGLCYNTARFRQLSQPVTIAVVCSISIILAFMDRFVTGPHFYFPWKLFGDYPTLPSGDYFTMQVIIVVWQFMMYGGWSMVYFLARSSSEGAARKQKLKEGEAKRQEAELEMLRSQINPHFLFNAMNTIASESDGNPRIGKIVDGLSDFLRYSLSSRGKSLVPFGDELHATCQYLEVEKARYGESLKVNLDIEPSTSKVLLPGVLLQPLVENAIKHGRESSEDQLIIDLVATYDGEDFEIVVSNTGIWNPEILEHRGLHTGVGLPNIQQRLELSYQGRSSFQIGPIANRVVATIRINHPETSLPDG